MIIMTLCATTAGTLPTTTVDDEFLDKFLDSFPKCMITQSKICGIVVHNGDQV